MKLLIVDDSMVIRKMIENDLQDLELEIVGTASNGREAVAIFKNTKPELVTLDITMPEMDGLDCLKKMLELKPEAKIIMVTALSDKATVLRALTLGAAGYITKPFQTMVIRQKLMQLIKGQ